MDKEASLDVNDIVEYYQNYLLQLINDNMVLSLENKSLHKQLASLNKNTNKK